MTIERMAFLFAAVLAVVVFFVVHAVLAALGLAGWGMAAGLLLAWLAFAITFTLRVKPKRRQPGEPDPVPIGGALIAGALGAVAATAAANAAEDLIDGAADAAVDLAGDAISGLFDD
jgi:multisubunit Na+/H+ antiporter MnhB subunit